MSLTKSAVVILKLSVKTELFEKALDFVKERLVETRAFQAAKNARLHQKKSDIIIYQIWDSFEDQKNMSNGEQRRNARNHSGFPNL